MRARRVSFIACVSLCLVACPDPKGTPDPPPPYAVDDDGGDPTADAHGETELPAADVPPDAPHEATPDSTLEDGAQRTDASGDALNSLDAGDPGPPSDTAPDGPPACPPQAPCEDGDGCTDDDTCSDEGVCVAGAPKICDDGEVCTEDGCDPASGDCVAPISAGASCDDGEVCTVDDVCQADGTCSGALNACDDGDLCTLDFCDAGFGCGTLDACDDGSPCTTDSCDATSGACTHTPLAAGTSCDDGDLCTQGTTCQSGGACGDGTPAISCDDANACTFDACEPSTGECVHLGADGEKCDDDGDVCTQDVCDATGACVHPLNPACGDRFKEIFECGGATDWTFAIASGDVEWDIDGQPAPGDHDGSGCSLNFNADALSYASTGGTASTAAATSPEIDATSVPDALFVAFWSYLDTSDPPTSEWDNAELRISDDGFQTYTALSMGIEDPDLGTWQPIIIDITAHAGSVFQLRFHFDSVDGVNNVGAGWFVDNLLVTGTLPTEVCDDNALQDDYDNNGDCTDTDCALAPSCLIDGDTCLLPFETLDSTSLPSLVVGDTSAMGPHYGYGAADCYGAPESAGGAFLQGSPDAVYRFTPVVEGQYVFTLDATFDSAIFVATDCQSMTGSCVGGSNDSGAGQAESLSLHLSAGVEHFVVVDGAATLGASDAGAYTLGAARPAESHCADGIDNDDNGATDCDESTCALAPDCGTELCGNGVDDDNDALVDCADPECDPICVAEICDNSDDDDGDGDPDCLDSECTLAPSCVPPGDTCSNALTVDASALPWSSPVVDTSAYLPHYGDETGSCHGATGSAGGGMGFGAPDLVYAFTPQADGVYAFTFSADFDARLYLVHDCDAVPTSCRGIAPANASLGAVLNAGQTVYVVIDGASDADSTQSGTGQLVVALASETSCDDATDNDGNDDTDCDDAACTYAPNCVPEEDCLDGADNDFDGDIDCDDSECTSLCAEAGHCDDEVDNDGDGQTDCQDTADCAAAAACIPEVCDNLSDDDGDGDADCDDEECASELVCLPPGDACGNALTVELLPFDHDGDSCALGDHVTTSGGAGCNPGGAGLGDAIYTYTAPSDQVLWLSLPKSATSADLQLNVATSCGEAIDECVASSDVAGLGGEFITLQVTAGQTITVVVDGDNATFQPSCGPYRLHIEQQSPEIGACDDGEDNDADGFFDCADPQCQGDPVCGCTTDADCDDVNICTTDHCADVQGALVCAFTPVACDDGDPCTANRCHPSTGCAYPASSSCPAAVPYATDFQCDDLDWSFATVEGTVQWAIDGTPNPPGFLSAECSLNFNNGLSYDSLDGNPSNGHATLIPVDAGAASTLWVSYVDLFLAESTTFETRLLQVSTDGLSWSDYSSGHVSNQKGTWRWRMHDLSAFAGSGSVYVRFVFDSQDQLTNDEEGWFIDNLRITDEEPGLGEVCDDGVDNDEDLATDCADTECVGTSGC